MRVPRMTTRRWLWAIALLALGLVAFRSFRTLARDWHEKAVDEWWNNHPGVETFGLENAPNRPPDQPWWFPGP